MNDREALILGALLHDIGKFMQRSLPKGSGSHTELGGEFFQNHLREKLFASRLFSIDELNNIESAIRDHHREGVVEFISHADQLSAGTDRIPLEKEETADPRLERLESLLEKIHLPEGEIESPTKRRSEFTHKLVPLSLKKEDIFPNKFPEELLGEEYKILWEGFIKEIDNLPTNNFNIFLESLYYLLWKYTWCVPSAAYKSEPDISLFDHLKTTAAITACLFDWNIDREKEPRYTLLCGDISGIQKFIYNITSKGAAKGLKGRSFYLQLLAEATGKYILKRLDYSLTNMLYASGGKFYLLLADKYDDRLRQIQKEINGGLLEKYDGELFMALGGCSFPRSDFLGNNFPPKWRLAAQKANRQKRRKFSDTDYKKIFSPFGKGALEETCEICKKEEPELKLCPDCRDAEKLGETLSRAEYIAEVYNEKKNINGNAFDIPSLKTKYYCLKVPGELEGIEAEKVVLYKLNSTDFLPGKSNINSCAYGFRFIAGDFIPRDEEDNPLTFNDFAEQSQGIKRLGILRMDIDNLGLIFAKGFGKIGSISRVTSLSRNLSLFFDGYLNQICQSEKYKDYVFIIYSGGDDLFIVGSWDKVVELAEDVYIHFKDFVCQNEYLTLSGGVSLTTKKHPIYKGAEYAGEAEEIAKDYKRKVKSGDGSHTKEKDAITFFNKPVGWNDFEICRKIKNLLYFCIVEGKEDEDGNMRTLPKAILDRLRRIYLLYQRNKNDWEGKKEISREDIEEKIKYNKWLWRMVYSLGRSSKQNNIFQEEIGRIKSALVGNQFDGAKSEREIIDLIDIPARWVEFLIRKEG